jgi:hypothetical protein
MRSTHTQYLSRAIGLGGRLDLLPGWIERIEPEFSHLRDEVDGLDPHPIVEQLQNRQGARVDVETAVIVEGHAKIIRQCGTEDVAMGDYHQHPLRMLATYGLNHLYAALLHGRQAFPVGKDGVDWIMKDLLSDGVLANLVKIPAFPVAVANLAQVCTLLNAYLQALGQNFRRLIGTDYRAGEEMSYPQGGKNFGC